MSTETYYTQKWTKDYETVKKQRSRIKEFELTGLLQTRIKDKRAMNTL